MSGLIEGLPCEPFTITIERGWRDNISMTATHCHDAEVPRPELTSIAKMLLELANRNGELHEYPDIIEEIRKIIA